MRKVFFFSLLLGLLLAGCGGASQSEFVLSKASEFRYKNTQTSSLYLPQKAKVCVLNAHNDLPKSKQQLQIFITNEWRDKAVLQDSCMQSDFYLKLYQVHDRFRYDFYTLKLSIVERASKNIIADFTLSNQQNIDQGIDHPQLVQEFASIFLTSRRIFGN